MAAPSVYVTASSVAVKENLPGVAATGIIKEIPEIGPGWTVSIVPRKSGERNDYYYFSPTGQRFRGLKLAKAQAASEKAKDEQDKIPFGVGYKFSKKFENENGNSLGWYDGEVVDILTGTGE